MSLSPGKHQPSCRRRFGYGLGGLACLLAGGVSLAAAPRFSGDVSPHGGSASSTAGAYTLRQAAVIEAVAPAGTSSGRFASVFQASSGLGRLNSPPTALVTLSEVGGDERSEVTLTHAQLAALFGVDDADGDPPYFRVLARAGSLSLAGSAPRGAVLLSPGQSLGWQVPSFAEAPLAELRITAHDGIADGPVDCHLRLVYVPKLSTPVASRSVQAGEPADFSVSAYGTMPLNYEWFLNGQPLSGATNAALRLTPATRSEGGMLEVRVVNRAGEITGQGRLRVLVPMRATSLTWNHREGVRVTFVDSDGGTLPATHPLGDFVMEYSEDLKTWSALPPGEGPLREADGRLRMNDPASTNRVHRFYRLLERGED